MLRWLLIGMIAALFYPAVHLLLMGPLMARWRRKRLYRGLYENIINSLKVPEHR